jgi:hypothetical protein
VTRGFTGRPPTRRGRAGATEMRRYGRSGRPGPSPPPRARRYRQAMRTIVGATSSGGADASDRRVVEALTLLLKLPEHTYGSNDGLVVGWPWDNAAFDRLAANKVRRTRARARLSSMDIIYTYICIYTYM